MAAEAKVPATLFEAVRYFSDPDVCLNFFAKLRWPGGIAVCPRCECKETYFLATRHIWKCKGCAKQFSVKVGTIFEDSPLGLDKWLPAIWLIANTKNGTSSWELHRDLGITQKSAWFMAHRIRRAMQTGSFEKKLCGEIEADESFISGKARNMHRDKRVKSIHGRGPFGKAVVMAGLERHGEIRTAVSYDINPSVNLSFGSTSQSVRKYCSGCFFRFGIGLTPEFAHQVINHAEKYVDGNVHTNNCENWSLLKRSINGTYVSVEPFHLYRYLDEQAFRYNKRQQTDSERFLHVCSSVVGRRLTWQQLIGSSDEAGEA